MRPYWLPWFSLVVLGACAQLSAPITPQTHEPTPLVLPQGYQRPSLPAYTAHSPYQPGLTEPPITR